MPSAGVLMRLQRFQGLVPNLGKIGAQMPASKILRIKLAALMDESDIVHDTDRRHFLRDVQTDPPGSAARRSAGRSVYFIPLADLVAILAKAEREGTLREKIRFLCRCSLLVVDEIGYLPVTPGGGNLFFQLVNARYEKGAMILTSNRGFAEWGEVFGDPVVATALLDRLLHHAVVVQIEGSSYRMRQHADLVPEHVRSNSPLNPPPAPKRRGRPPKALPDPSQGLITQNHRRQSREF